ncbi:MAG: ABC transporter permease subunit [Ilumatobacteraceae bacterium]
MTAPVTLPGRRASATKGLRHALAVVLPPVVLGVVMIAAWEAFINWQDVRPFVMPAPSAIWREFTDNFSLVRDAMMVTGTNAFIGLVFGTLLGVFLAAVANRFRFLGEILTPLAVAIAAIPAVVIVSVLNNMYSVTTQTGRRVMVTLAVFFIIFIQVSRGLRQSQPTQLELMRSYAASPREVMRKVRIPNAMAYLFIGIRTAAPVAVIIALVSEYFGGTQDGLGQKIAANFSLSKSAFAFAYVLGGSIVGLLFLAVASLLEYFAVPWQRRRTTR